MKTQYDVMVVGGGIAGVSAARAAAEAGARRVLLVGEEDCLPYKRTSLSKHLASGFAPDAFDLPLVRHPDGRLSAADAGSGAFAYRQGFGVTGLDAARKTVRLAGGEEVSAGRIVLACGAEALCGPGGRHILTLRTKADAARIHSRIVPGASALVVGSGVLGVEAAAQLAQAGMRVVLSGRPGPVLGRLLPDDLAALAGAALGRLGVRIVPGLNAEEVREDDEGVVVADGTRHALALLAVGVRPRAELAAAAGLPVGRGIRVDERLETVVPGIFAAGDCAEHPGGLVSGLWRLAEVQGRIAGINATGGSVVWDRAPQRIKCRIGDFFVYSARREEASDERMDIDGPGSRIAFSFREDRLVSVQAAGCDPALDGELSAALAAGLTRRETRRRFMSASGPGD